MNRKRLEKLANFLETDEIVNTKGKFHLNYWMEPFKDRDVFSIERSTTKAFQKAFATFQKQAGYDDAFKPDGQPHHCKTMGCALGWAATIPSFRKAGLRKPSMPSFRYLTGYDAASEFFDINMEMTMHIFDPYEYTLKEQENPKVVAKRIHKILEKGDWSHES